MARLIDADALIQDIVKTFGCKPHIEVGNKSEYIHKIIENQPTAYDPEIVIQQIGDISEPVRPVGWSRKIEVVETKEAIEIVRKGGVE